MSDKVFLDTNILVYAYDNRDQPKQRRAQSIIKDALRNRTAVISAQVLGEFVVVVTRKIPNAMTPREAASIIDQFQSADVVALDLVVVRRAIAAQVAFGVSYWDGLIIAAAERAGCSMIYSEDLNNGQKYHSIVVENPFTKSLY